MTGANGTRLNAKDMTRAERYAQHDKIVTYLESGAGDGKTAMEISGTLDVSDSAARREIKKRGATIGFDGLLRMPGGAGQLTPRNRRSGYRQQSFDVSWAKICKVMEDTPGRVLNGSQIAQLTGIPTSSVYTLLRQHGILAADPGEQAAVMISANTAVLPTVDAEIVASDGAQEYAGQLRSGEFLGRDERGQIWIWRRDRLL